MRKPAQTRDRTWQWIIGAIVLLLLVWGVTRLVVDEEVPLAGRAVGIPVVAPDPVVPVDPLRPGEDGSYVVATAAGEDAIPVAAIAITPEPFYGRRMVGVAVVAADQDPAVAADKGFWLEQDGRRIFAVFARPPVTGSVDADDRAAPGAADTADAADTVGSVEVMPGQRIELSGQVYPGELASQVGADLDPGTQLMLSSQPAFLLVEPGAGTVVQQPPATSEPVGRDIQDDLLEDAAPTP